MANESEALQPFAVCAQHPDQKATGTCERCGNFVCSGCAEGSTLPRCATCRAREPLSRRAPWERRAELGVVRAFAQTAVEVLGSPRRFFTGLELSGGVVPPLVFGVLLVVLRHVLSLAAELGKRAVESGFAFSSLRAGFGILGIPLVLLMQIGFVHLVCRLFRAHDRPIAATARVVAYSASVTLTAVPVVLLPPVPAAVVGWLPPLLHLVVVGGGLVWAAGARPWRTFGALLVPTLGFSCLFIALYQVFQHSSST